MTGRCAGPTGVAEPKEGASDCLQSRWSQVSHGHRAGVGALGGSTCLMRSPRGQLGAPGATSNSGVGQGGGVDVAMEMVREPLFLQETPWLAGWSSGLGGLHCLCVGRGLPLFCLSLTLGWRGGRGAAHSEPRPLGPPLHFHFLRVGWPCQDPLLWEGHLERPASWLGSSVETGRLLQGRGAGRAPPRGTARATLGDCAASLVTLTPGSWVWKGLGSAPCSWRPRPGWASPPRARGTSQNSPSHTS